MLDFWRKLRSRSPTKSAFSGVNKIKRLEAIISKKNRDMRFNNNPEALIFGSFDQAKEQRTDFRINHLKNTTNLFHLQIFSPNSE
jgi:hypothetical protein